MDSRVGTETTLADSGDSPPSRPAGRVTRSVLVWTVALVVVLAAAGYALWHRSGPAPVLPEEIDRLDPELLVLIEDHAGRVRENRRDAEAHGRLGLVYEANSMFAEAQRCFTHAVELEDWAPLWHYHLALVAREGGDVEGALEVLRGLARKHRKFAALHHRLGVWLLEAGEIEEAEGAFRVATRLNPAAPHPLVGLAEVELRNGDPAGAASLLERALRIDPDYDAAHYALGLAYRGLGRHEEAARELQRGVSARPRYMSDRLSLEMAQYVTYPAGRLAQAEHLMANGRPAEAVALLEKGLATQPDHARLTLGLAKAYVESGRHGEALELLLRVRRGDDHRVEILLARCHLELSRYKDALEHADRAVAIDDQYARSHLARGSVLLSMARYAEALASLETAVGLGASSPEIHLSLGETCLALERYGEARMHFHKALELRPEMLEAQVKLGAACIALGRLDEAASALATARRLAPSDRRVVALQRRLAVKRSGG